MQELEKINALALVDDYVLPAGMVDFKSIADMVKESMLTVKENPTKENVDYMRAISDGAKTMVQAGVAQNQQMNNMLGLMTLNKEWKLNRERL
jgi:deoxyribose-phosphate aldolase